MPSRARVLRGRAGAGLAIFGGLAGPLVFGLACSVERVSEVVVRQVAVRPVEAIAIEGDSLTLDAIVEDEVGAPLPRAVVTWASDAPEVATVDRAGTVRAHGEGVATITASFQGAEGTATVAVLRGPSIRFEPTELVLRGGAEGAAPRPGSVVVHNGGAGALAGLDAEISYEDEGPRGWLSLDWDDTQAPATLDLAAATDSLSVGRYEASVTVFAADERVEPEVLPVRLVLTGYSVNETGGGTRAAEGGAGDAFRVALGLEPESEVVLEVRSGDEDEVAVEPGRLTFTPTDWSEPRVVTVSAVDDDVVDGSRSTTVAVRPHEDTADSAWLAAVERRIEVATEDDDLAGLVVTETGPNTIANEGGVPDTLRVQLAARPLTDVVVTVTVDDPGDAAVSPDRLLFRPAEWDQPQSVAFIAVDDPARDGIRVRSVTFAVEAASSDPAFHGLSRTIGAVTVDNDFLWRSSPP